MSQFNGIYGLFDINIFNDITDTTEYHSDNNEIYYKATVSINPTNRLHAIGEVIDEKNHVYRSTVKVYRPNVNLYMSKVRIIPSNNIYLKIGVLGMGNKEYRATFRSWDDRRRLYHASFSTILDSKISLFNASVTISKDSEKLYKARFVINPTNRLIAIGNISGYYESMYNATVNITAERYNVYRATVRVSLGSNLYARINVLQTSRHLFYGDLKKDTHAIESLPNINYGGSNNLFMNNESIVFLEWDFGVNMDDFYQPGLEYGSGLKITIQKAIPNGSTGRVYLVNNDWDEYGLTYNNKPTDLNFIREFTIPRNWIGELDISLGSLLADYMKLNPFKVSLAVEVDSPIDTYSNSRETNIMIPALYYAYYYIPPNNRQNIYSAKVSIKKAYGKGNGVDTEFPALGEELNWSYPAKIWGAVVKDKLTDPIKFYNAKIKIKATNIEHMYMAYVFNYNPIIRTGIYRSNVKIKKFDSDGIYNAFINIPNMNYELYNAKLKFVMRTRDKNYIASVRILRAYGKGSGSHTEFPGLRQELPWSKPAKIWNGVFNTIGYSKDNLYMATLFNDSTRHLYYRMSFNIPRYNTGHLYNAIITNRIDRDIIYNALINTPKYDKNLLYPATVLIQVPGVRLYEANINIPLYTNDSLYMALHTVIKPKELLFNAKIYIIPDRVNVHIFIM